MHALPAWDPFQKKDITALEDVQKFALLMCTKSWDHAGLSVFANYIQLAISGVRRHQAKLCPLFKIVNADTYFPDAPLTNWTLHYAVRSSREHSLMLLLSMLLITNFNYVV